MEDRRQVGAVYLQLDRLSALELFFEESFERRSKFIVFHVKNSLGNSLTRIRCKTRSAKLLFSQSERMIPGAGQQSFYERIPGVRSYL